MSKIFLSLAAVTGILVLSVAFLMWGYFNSQARIEEHESTIAEQGVLIEGNETAIQELVSAIVEHDRDIDELYDAKVSLESDVNSLETEVNYLEVLSTTLKEKVNTLEAEWQRLAALGGYREFGSVSELQWWLWNDLTSEHEYIPIYYDCDDFAMDLTLAAIRDGRWIGLFAINGHIKNFAKIGNCIYGIEPQTDAVSFWGYVD